jgi:hypothetical protein
MITVPPIPYQVRTFILLLVFIYFNNRQGYVVILFG